MRTEEEKQGEHPMKYSAWLIIIMIRADFLIDVLLGSPVPVFLLFAASNRLPLDGTEAHT